jgi:hypothetical protein
MKSIILSIATTALFAATAQLAQASDAAYSGTWKIDVAKSKLTGATFTYAASPGGKIRYSNGSSATYLFACDAKPYPTIPGETVTCSKGGPSGYTLAYMTKGKLEGTEVDTVSGGGKMLTIVNHDVYANGKTRMTTTQFVRVGPGTGPIGAWKSAKTHSNSPATFTLAATPTVINYESKLSGTKVVLKLDGTKSPLVGANVPPGLFVIVKASGPSGFTFAVLAAGKETGDSTWTLSNGGKTLSWTSWVPGKKAEATTAVYEKQS